MYYNSLFIRFLSLLTSFCLFNWFLRGLVVLSELENHFLFYIVELIAVVLYLIASFLLFLDFLNVKKILVKKTWLPIFLLGFLLNNISKFFC